MKLQLTICKSMTDSKLGSRVQAHFCRFMMVFVTCALWQESVSGNPSTVTEITTLQLTIALPVSRIRIYLHVCISRIQDCGWEGHMGSIIKLKTKETSRTIWPVMPSDSENPKSAILQRRDILQCRLCHCGSYMFCCNFPGWQMCNIQRGKINYFVKNVYYWSCVVFGEFSMYIWTFVFP